MADVIDRAQASERLGLESEIRRARQATAEDAGSGICEDCESEIPAARQAAVLGCRRCVECQTLFEKEW